MPRVPEEVGDLSGELSPIEALPVGDIPLSEANSPKPSGRVLGALAGFFVGQGASQAVTTLAGLFLVRRLSVEAYAQFGLAMGFQAVFANLMDLGITSTIIPMVGERRDDRSLVGRYVRAAKHLRDRAFWILAPVASLVFLPMMHRQHWGWGVQLFLLASVLLALYSGGKVSCYAAPLLLFGRLRDYYVPQVLAGSGRLAIYIVLGFVGGLNAATAACLGALNVTVCGSWLARKSQPFLKWPAREDPATDRELFRYILPAAPAMIFSAFQPQVSLFLVSVFGADSTYIAQVAALSKIVQLFAVLMTFNIIVIEPYVARLSRPRLLPTYLALVSLAALACTPVVLIAFAWPQVFLWLLGPKYEELRGVMGYVILSGCMNYVAGLMWIMNRARKWVFWSGTVLEIGLLISTQAAFVAFLGIRNTRQAVFLSLTASFCYIVAHVYGAIYGFIKGPRIISPSQPALEE
jgi:O-antigen/teichoic acid export membrane protein